MNEPDELLHMALPDDWEAARATGEYRISSRGLTLDEQGFIHCSYPSQIETVANAIYHDVAELVLLHIEPTLLDDAEVKIEPGSNGETELFPHIYGAIPTTAVVATTWWDRGDDGVWHRPHTM